MNFYKVPYVRLGKTGRSPRERLALHSAGVAAGLRKIVRGIGRRLDHASRAAVSRGLPSAWTGYRWMRHEPLETFISRLPDAASRIEMIHGPREVRNPLPANFEHLEQLADDAGWWGYSMRDVPRRQSAPTFKAVVPHARLLFAVEPSRQDFQVALLGGAKTAIALREVAYRPGHGAMLRAAKPAVHLRKATWILERVYHNHSHWLTAHLPKLVLLRDRDELSHLLLPRKRTAVMDESIRMLGLNPEAFRTFDPSSPLEVEELTVLSTDRFCPELLQATRSAIGHVPASRPWRRIFISRARSRGRNLTNESQIWPMLEQEGFEAVFMEELTFSQQVKMMGECAVLLAPHGAGITNILFCQPGAHVVEIADPGYPNPNFYALACAMGLHYWLVAGEARGEGHALDKSLRVDIGAVRSVLDRMRCSREPAAPSGI